MARVPGQSPSQANDACDELDALLEKHGLAEFYVRPSDGRAVMTNSYRRRGFEELAAAYNMSPDELEQTPDRPKMAAKGGRPFRLAKICAELVTDAEGGKRRRASGYERSK